MSSIAAQDLEAMVRPAEVHKRLYVDPDIFDLEMDRIFGSAWVYVGHESQVPNPGDYWTTLIGKEQVIMVRGADDQVRVLFNRCPHKGAKLVNEVCGNVSNAFRCPYHAWMFKLDGSLMSIPHRQGYEDTGFDAEDAHFWMRSVARQASHRGFVFASLSEDGPDLETFLGGALTSLDNFCDRAPEGEVEVSGGVFRVVQQSNWKIFFENLNDTGHPVATHESSFMAARRYSKEKLDGKLPFELHIIDGNGEPFKFWESL
ncbi:MAG: Rieske 2Fe-2S domain-containing protein, partial [Pseudomonadota bacterium]